MGEKIRTFVAISLPESVLRAMGKTQERLRRFKFDVRWARSEGIHLTLKFLGDIEEKDVAKVGDAMARACEGVSSFVLKGEGTGVFPDMKRPRVIWVGVSGDVSLLTSLQERLEGELEKLGFPREKRGFTGHLTLGRVKSRLDETLFRQALKEAGDFVTDPFDVKSIVLFKSTLRPQGAVYDKLAEVSLRSE